MSTFIPINQNRAREALRSAIASERVAHAYLFHGPDGVGKCAVALEFAKALLCEKASGVACGSCIPCQKVSRGVHPDLHVLIPQPKDADPADVAARLSRLFQNPYATVDFARRPVLDDPERVSSKQAGYLIDRVHSELHRAFSFKPVEGAYKIGILTDAHLLGGQSANAFLKLLEEPSPRTVFVLTTSRIDHILPTILSRCQRVVFAPLPPAEIASRLADETDLKSEDAEVIAQMSDGSLSRALDLAVDTGLMAMRASVVRLFRVIWAVDGSRKPDDLDVFIDMVAQHAGLGRERLKNLLRLMLGWLGDIVTYRATGQVDLLVNVDQAEQVQKFADNLSEANVPGMIRLVEEAFELTQRNVHLTLLVSRLYNELRRAMRGEEVDRLYVPLVEWTQTEASVPAP
jgi:DNA polymerase-3 subunit delta'